MTFRVYRCGYLSQKKERGFMDDLRRFLEKEFDGTKEDVRLVIDPQPRCQIDGVIFKDGKLIVLELKDLEGRIVADLNPESKWRFLAADGSETPVPGENPALQAVRHRRLLMDFLWQQVLKKPGTAPSGSRDRFAAWIVVRPKTDIVRTNWEPADSYWLDVLPLDFVVHALANERGGGSAISVEELEELLRLLGAEQRPPIEWMRPGRIAPGKSAGPGHIPAVDFLLESVDADRVLSGLDFVKNLNLRDYAPDLARLLGHAEERVREQAARVLITWEEPELCEVFGRLLADNSGRLQLLALESLRDRACPSLVPIVEEFLEVKDGTIVALALDVLANSTSSDSGGIVLSFAKRLSIAGYIAWLRTGVARTDVVVPLEAPIRSLARLRYREAIPWLLEILDALGEFGPIAENSDLSVLWQETLLALGRLRDPIVFDRLVKALSEGGAEWAKAPVKALGLLGDERAVEHLLPYLDDNDRYLVGETVEAFMAIGSEKAFDRLCEVFVNAVSSDGIGVTIEIMRALAEISPGRTEEFVLTHLRDPGTHENLKWRLLDLLYSVATEKSVETLFSLLPDHRYYEETADILGRKIATPAVFHQAEVLLASRSGSERAGALYIMCRSWGASLLSELEKYESDGAPEVRRIVAWEYRSLKSASGRHRLLAMSRDDDADVRQHVYHAFLEEPLAGLERGFLFHGGQLFPVGLVLLSEEALITGTETTDEDRSVPATEQYREDPVLFVMEIRDCERAAVLKVDGIVGLYLGGRQAGTPVQWALLPGPLFPPWMVEQSVRDFRLKLLEVSNRPLGSHEVDSLEADFVRTAILQLPKRARRVQAA